MSTDKIPLPIRPGDEITFHRTVTVTDIYLYAGLSGDFSPNHVDKRSDLGEDLGRIAHGTLVMGLMSTASSLLHERHGKATVSYGYDRVRFIKAVRVGDTLSINYRIEETDEEKRRGFSRIICTNQHGETVAAAIHITQFVGETDD